MYNVSRAGTRLGGYPPSMPNRLESVRRLGCVTPYNQRIFTPTLQCGVRGMSPSQDGTAGLQGFRAIWWSGPYVCAGVASVAPKLGSVATNQRHPAAQTD